MTNKSTYDAAARQINGRLKVLDGEGLKPRVSVMNTEQHGYGFGKWSLMVNDDLYEFAQHKGLAQDLLYGDEIYTIGDADYYIEPVTRVYFAISIL